MHQGPFVNKLGSSFQYYVLLWLDGSFLSEPGDLSLGLELLKILEAPFEKKIKI